MYQIMEESVRIAALGCKRMLVVAIVFLPLLVSPFTFPLQKKSRSSQLYSSTSSSKGSQSERLSKAKAMLEELMIDTPELMEKAASTDPSVVPETYWSNGHLQPQADFVTRWVSMRSIPCNNSIILKLIFFIFDMILN